MINETIYKTGGKGRICTSRQVALAVPAAAPRRRRRMELPTTVPAT